MKFIVVSSGSSGNCYIFKNNNETLIWEAGVKFKEVLKALDFNVSDVVGCISSHIHGDHFGKAKEFINYGIDIYTSQGTIDASGIISSRLHPVKEQVKFRLGGFTILPVSIIHDAPEPFAFLIHHEEMGLVCALTDSHYSPFIFKGLNNIICEANYSEEIIDERVASGKLNHTLRDRVLTSHMSFETATGFLAANDLSQVNNIVLIHLSDSNSHAINFKKETERRFGKPTHIASKGMQIEFNKSSF